MIELITAFLAGVIFAAIFMHGVVAWVTFQRNEAIRHEQRAYSLWARATGIIGQGRGK